MKTYSPVTQWKEDDMYWILILYDNSHLLLNDVYGCSEKKHSLENIRKDCIWNLNNECLCCNIVSGPQGEKVNKKIEKTCFLWL